MIKHTRIYAPFLFAALLPSVQVSFAAVGDQPSSMVISGSITSSAAVTPKPVDSIVAVNTLTNAIDAESPINGDGSLYAIMVTKTQADNGVAPMTLRLRQGSAYYSLIDTSSGNNVAFIFSGNLFPQRMSLNVVVGAVLDTPKTTVTDTKGTGSAGTGTGTTGTGTTGSGTSTTTPGIGSTGSSGTTIINNITSTAPVATTSSATTGTTASTTTTSSTTTGTTSTSSAATCADANMDVNKDGVCTQADIDLIKDYISGVAVGGGAASLDVNKDGVVNTRDIIDAIKAILLSGSQGTRVF